MELLCKTVIKEWKEGMNGEQNLNEKRHADSPNEKKKSKENGKL